MSVFSIIWKTPCLLKLKKIISLSRGRTLSGHTWFTAKKFSILNLSSLHPSSKPYLGKPVLGQTVKLVDYGPQLLGDSLGWSDYESDAHLCLHLLGQAQDGVAQQIQGARGLAVGATTPDTHGRLHGLHRQGWSNPQDEDLRCTVLLSMYRKTSRAIS